VKLKPCPFCGHKNLWKLNEPHVVHCPHCGAKGPEYTLDRGSNFTTNKQSVDAWNKRTVA
jgi:Lar family restriction alleviation protein